MARRRSFASKGAGDEQVAIADVKEASAPVTMSTFRKLSLCALLVAMQCIFDLLVEIVKVRTAVGRTTRRFQLGPPSCGRCRPPKGAKSRSRFQRSR